MLVSSAAIAFAGPDAIANDDSGDVLGLLGTQVLGSPLDKLVIIAVLTSAAASTQTTILPTARTSLSMARAGAMPASLGRIHPRYQTPHVSTVLMGALSIVWYVGLTLVSENILFDSIAALGLMIAFYYGLTGFACVIYYRHELIKSVKNFFFVGVAPLIGGARCCCGCSTKSCVDLSKPENSESGDSWLGVGPPLVIGLGFLLLGVVLMLLWTPAGTREFFRRKRETADPGSLEAPPPAAPGGDRGDRLMAAPIVVGYDGTPGARAAGGEALRLARDLGGELVFGYCYSVSATGGEVGDLEAALREQGTAVLHEALAQAHAAGLEARAALVHDKPSAGLVGLADENDARMIVVGSYGEPPLKGALIGSTAHKLLHLSERPCVSGSMPVTTDRCTRPGTRRGRHRAVVITKAGPPEVLQVQERPDPEPGPGQVAIDVRAAGVNFADTMARVGLYPDAPKLPAVVGYEVAGRRGSPTSTRRAR